MLITRGPELGDERHSGDRSWVSRERQTHVGLKGVVADAPREMRALNQRKASAGVGSLALGL